MKKGGQNNIFWVIRDIFLLLWISSNIVLLWSVLTNRVERVEPVTSEPVEEYTVEEYPDTEIQGDPNNYIYPFNEMSADWDQSVYDEGFRYYEIPKECTEAGGCFPEVVQVYLWNLCKNRGLDYYIVVAQIGQESDYKWDAFRAGDNSIGYMQIIEKYHKDRIAEENADITSPYGNLRVGVDFLADLYDQYGDYHKALMCYNMGEAGAVKCWRVGQYRSDYSTKIINRAQEIRRVLQGA